MALEQAGYATELELLEAGTVALDGRQAEQLRRPTGSPAPSHGEAVAGRRLRGHGGRRPPAHSR
jgi:hypothetical protein